MKKLDRLKMAKDISIVAAFDIIAKLIVGFSTILLIRIVSVETYALYVKFNSISSLIFGVIGTSMATTFARCGTEYISRGYNYTKKIYKVCLLLLSLVTILLFVLHGIIGKVYSVQSIIVLTALVYGVFQSVNKVNQGYFQIRTEYQKAGVLENLKNILQFVVFLSFWIFSLDIKHVEVFGVFIISSFIPLITGSVAIHRLEIKKQSDLIHGKEYLRVARIVFNEGIVLIIYMLLLNLMDQTDVVLVNRLLDSGAVANYGVALKYYTLLLTLQASLTTVFRIRTASKDMVDDQNMRARFSRDWIRSTWKFILLISGSMLIFAGPVMNLLNGKAYTDSIPAFRVFVLGATISYLFAPNTAVMMSAKKHKLLCAYSVVGLMINAVIDYLLIPSWGISAAALATVSGNAFINITSFLTIQIANVKQNQGKGDTDNI